jgi:hypothetical protein
MTKLNQPLRNDEYKIIVCDVEGVVVVHLCHHVPLDDVGFGLRERRRCPWRRQHCVVLLTYPFSHELVEKLNLRTQLPLVREQSFVAENSYSEENLHRQEAHQRFQRVLHHVVVKLRDDRRRRTGKLRHVVVQERAQLLIVEVVASLEVHHEADALLVRRGAVLEDFSQAFHFDLVVEVGHRHLPTPGNCRWSFRR